MSHPERAEKIGAGPSPAAIEAQREVKDMGHWWVPVFAGLVFLGLATLLAFLWGVQAILGRPPAHAGFRPDAMAHAGDSARVMEFRALAPGLFPDPSGDLRRFLSEQEDRAPGYAWVDREAGVISIPVTRAMERIAASGWPRWDLPGVVGGAAAPPIASGARPDTAGNAGVPDPGRGAGGSAK
jgi:hypothetical protein